MERPAVPPAAAALAADATPVTIRPKTRGTRVMRSASSHSPPTTSAAATICAAAATPLAARPTPMASPAASPARIR